LLERAGAAAAARGARAAGRRRAAGGAAAAGRGAALCDVRGRGGGVLGLHGARAAPGPPRGPQQARARLR
ncbi:unnamed protein product, partial [Prorocentrum cordatum]